MKHILIVDDDIYISNMVKEVLEKEGYKTSCAYSGTEALLFLEKERPDLILLDLMLPGMNGDEVIKNINNIPTIVVSAKDDVNDKVRLLINGAEDYIAKPFDIDELLARIKVQFRKNEKTTQSEKLIFDDIILDKAKFYVSVNHKEVKLTKTEFAILKLLMENAKQVITKSILLDKISEDTPDCVESSLKVHISNLRKKLKKAGNKNYIEAVWGIGFKLIEK